MRALLLIFIATMMSLPSVANTNGTQQGISLLGNVLLAPAKIHPVAEKNLAETKAAYIAMPDDADAIIWYGRRMAYTGDYRSAIEIFSEGIAKHPADARMYRHRGHRYISLRELNKAVADFTKASELIEGTENAVEPDGIPNAQGIPVSTTHGNIWYHLGLAHYLKQDFEKALWAYKNARNTANSADNVVSTTHWLYMILQRLGRKTEAQSVLAGISEDMPVIENFAYHQLCLFYKGDWSLEKLLSENSSGPQGAGMAYGIANWHIYNGSHDAGTNRLRAIIENTSDWPAFGYIAAEADLAAFENETN